MLAFSPLRGNVCVRVNFAAVNHWQVSLDVEGERSELANVDTLASAQLVVEVGD